MKTIDPSERLVVIGNGMVGLRFLEKLLDRAPGRYGITVIGAEPRPAYNRILLSSLLAGSVGEGDVEYRGAGWYAANEIDLRVGVPALRIDADRRIIDLADGSEIPFERVVIATGSDPVRLPLPGADLPGVVTFRDRADVERIRSLASHARKAVVIGGGLLGLEAAYGLNRLGVPTTVVHLMDRLMERQLDEAAASLLRGALAVMGIDICLDAETEALAGTSGVEAVILADGRRLEADLVVMAVGIRPNVTLAQASGITCNRGVLVDDTLATDLSGVHAIGECVEHRGVCYGLVEPGYAQADVLARRFAGEDALYPGSTVATHLKVSGVDVFSAGDFLADGGGDAITLADEATGEYRKLVVRDGCLAGAVLIGDTVDSSFYRDVIAAGTDISAIRDQIVFGPAPIAAA